VSQAEDWRHTSNQLWQRRARDSEAPATYPAKKHADFQRRVRAGEAQGCGTQGTQTKVAIAADDNEEGMMGLMSPIVCYKCGIEFHVPEHWKTKRHESSEAFWCPNGHQQFYVESTADKLRRERDRLKQELAYKDDEIRLQREMRETAERQASSARGQVTKLKKRANAGVCPCCNRTFLALQKHMKQKHPGFAAEDANTANVVSIGARSR
jgi:hypothetical protein